MVLGKIKTGTKRVRTDCHSRWIPFGERNREGGREGGRKEREKRMGSKNPKHLGDTDTVKVHTITAGVLGLMPLIMYWHSWLQQTWLLATV